jgi:5-methylcytosine-specific restriction protein A
MITVKQYQNAIKHLGESQKQVLIKMYINGPFDNSILISKVLGYTNVGSANLRIGTIGKKIGNYLNVRPNRTYPHSGRERDAYFTIIHDFENGQWDMQMNLKKAIEIEGWTKNINLNKDFFLNFDESDLSCQLFAEGKLLQVYVNRYERNAKARSLCLKKHGNKCFACFMDFKKVYGNDIPDIIHIHHVKPLSKLGKETITDILKDLIPLCPNCHSVVHVKKKLMSLKELKRRIKINNRTFDVNF